MWEQRKHSEAWLICAGFVCVPGWMKDILHVQYVPVIKPSQDFLCFNAVCKLIQINWSDYRVCQLMEKVWPPYFVLFQSVYHPWFLLPTGYNSSHNISFNQQVANN